MSKVTIIEPTLYGPGCYGEDGNRHGSGKGVGDTQPKLRVAAYARVSTEQDEQQSSYEAQVDYY